ncbi:hypothetical protein QJS10_CPB19g00436 [Acorus calamus]|uniref:Uncharacterized protein n=1 Tax=Acorus calamus TaxID=4465 RepID=A0AAV9CFS9_ACOCL|nr:hypothetical protein QJS10_CPB19g00436 [Acorus calamus]
MSPTSVSDNEISSICQLDKLEYLNTLVLSRNPIHDIGVSLAKAKSLTKSLPVELSHNTKLRNLDLGNNLISRFSELKVISSVQSLKNLNLSGNPIAQNDKLAKESEKRAKVSTETQVEETKPKKRKADKKNPKFDKIDDADAPFMDIVLSESARDNAMEGEGPKPLGG